MSEGSEFVALSRFRVTNGKEREVFEAFVARPRLVEQARGFVRMDVLCPTDDPAEFWLVTTWDDEGSFRDWHASHLYRESHSGIPPGLKLDPEFTQLRTFTRIPT